MYDWPDLRKLNVNEWMRRKSCRDYVVMDTGRMVAL